MEGTTAPQTPAPSPAARNWAIVAHLGPIALSLVSVGTLGWMVPLVVWLTQKEPNPFAAEHAREALNFQILLLILFVLTLPLTFLLMLPCLGIPAWIGIWLFQIVAAITAAMRASDGLPYRYPLTPSFLG